MWFNSILTIVNPLYQEWIHTEKLKLRRTTTCVKLLSIIINCFLGKKVYHLVTTSVTQASIKKKMVNIKLCYISSLARCWWSPNPFYTYFSVWFLFWFCVVWLSLFPFNSIFLFIFFFPYSWSKHSRVTYVCYTFSVNWEQFSLFSHQLNIH